MSRMSKNEPKRVKMSNVMSRTHGESKWSKGSHCMVTKNRHEVRGQR